MLRKLFKENLLTYHFEVNGQVDFGLCVHLTLINAGIFLADRLYSQVPIVWIGNVDNGDARVCCVDECVWCENGEIASSYPWNLMECGWYFLWFTTESCLVLQFYFLCSSPCIWALRFLLSKLWCCEHFRQSTVCRARRIWLVREIFKRHKKLPYC